MRHDASSLRRIFRRVASRFKKSARAAVYRPSLSEQSFVAFLNAPGLGLPLAANGRAAIVDASASTYDLAAGLRQRIGERFFVRPDEVPGLCERAYRSHPEWRLRLAESASEVVERGLPIYNSLGPVLDGRFSWASLAAGPGGDSLFQYRPHRFAFLPRLSLALLQGDLKAGQLVAILDGWIAEAESGRNPFCFGTNLVVIQRILATTWAWAFLAARPPARTPDGLGLEGRLLRILCADVRFLEPRLGSSAPNNHLLADHFAAVFLQFVVPEFIEKIDPEAESRFRDEYLRQTFEDGGSFEHSAHYHEFACEMGAAYLLLCERQSREPDSQLRKRIEALLRFQVGVTGADAIPLPFGNAVEDTMFPLDSGQAWCAGSLRELYRSLFGAAISPAPANDLTMERAFWLLGGRLAPVGNRTTEAPTTISYPEGGIYVFQDTELDGHLTFRTGPQEGRELASGHMHSDLLSVYFSRAGTPVIVDAGTYTYRRKSKHWPPNAATWRTYLVGPAAHNTLTIEGHDPLGNIDGDFRPMDVATRVRTREHSGPGLVWVEGSMTEAGPYTGYTRGVIHVVGQYWVVYDSLILAERGDLPCWYGFQFARGIRLTPGEGRVLVEVPSGHADIAIITTLGSIPSVLEGSLDPVGGWVSEQYGEIAPAPQLRYPLPQAANTSAFVFGVIVDQAPETLERIDSPDGGDGLCYCISRGDRKDILLLSAGRTSASSNGLEGLVFEGRLLWLRLESGKPVEIRWVDAQRVVWPEFDLNYEFDTPTGERVL